MNSVIVINLVDLPCACWKQNLFLILRHRSCQQYCKLLLVTNFIITVVGVYNESFYSERAFIVKKFIFTNENYIDFELNKCPYNEDLYNE